MPLIQSLLQCLDVPLHQVQVGDALLKIVPRDVVAGMELQFRCAGGFTDTVGHLFIGQFDGEDHRNLFFFYFVNEKGNGFRACLRLRGASGKSGVVIQTVGVRQIAEGKRSPRRMVCRFAVSTVS